MSQIRFTQSLFDERAPVYDEWVRGFWKAYADRVDGETVAVLREKNGPVSILDVGCGTGSRLARLLKDGGVVLSQAMATDLSMGMLAEAKRHLAPYEVRLFQADASLLPVKSETSDYVLMLYAVLGCLPDRASRRAALAECSRVLNAGGVLIIDVLSRFHSFYRDRPEVFENAKKRKAQEGWAWEEGDVMVEVEPGRPSFNHGFDRPELEALSRGLFSKAEWRCYDTETGQPSDEVSGHFFGVLKK